MLQKSKTHAIPLGNHVTQQKLTENTENRSALTKTPNFGIFRFIPVYSALFGCHSASFRCHSGSFQYVPVPFLFIPSHSGVIRFYSRVIRLVPAYSGLFRYILRYLCVILPHSGVIPLVPVCSCTILVHSVSFRRHSASFQHIPVYSGIFHSTPFRSCV